MKKVINRVYSIFSYFLAFSLLISIELNLLSLVGVDTKNIYVILVNVILNIIFLYRYYKPFKIFE